VYDDRLLDRRYDCYQGDIESMLNRKGKLTRLHHLIDYPILSLMDDQLERMYWDIDYAKPSYHACPSRDVGHYGAI
jgi:hypothetical protein